MKGGRRGGSNSDNNSDSVLSAVPRVDSITALELEIIGQVYPGLFYKHLRH